MKKMLALVLAIAMLVSIAGVASAATFSVYVHCTEDEKDNYTEAPATEVKTSTSTNGRIYVYSYDNVSTDEYTNHFRGQEVTASSRINRGSKWVTQYQEIPIENANIVAPKTYSVSARGNTNYSNYDGISRITLGGYFLANR